MHRKSILMLSVFLLMAAGSASYGVLLSDFEGSLDGWYTDQWIDGTISQSTIGATSGSGSMLCEAPGGYHSVGKVDAKSVREMLGEPGAKISVDVTSFAADMTGGWTEIIMVINAQGNDDNGAHNNIGYVSLGVKAMDKSGVPQTITWTIPPDLSEKIAGSDDSIGWFELLIISNTEDAPGSVGKFYVDNVQVLEGGGSASSYQIFDFEGGLDGFYTDQWIPNGKISQSTIGATSGTGSMLCETTTGGWQDVGKSDIKSVRGLLGGKGTKISVDVTSFAADMTGAWTEIVLVINAQGNDDNGANNNIGWVSLGVKPMDKTGVPQTIVWDMPDDLTAKIAGSDDSIAWFELLIISNTEDAEGSVGKFYVDNIQILIAGLANTPNPQNDAVDVRRDPTLTWTSGISAETHDVYFGADLDAVTNVTKDDLASYPDVTYQNIDVNSLTLDNLELGKTYYWRVDEANDASPDSPWVGEVWSFTVGDFLVVDDFEDYNDTSPDTVWDAWPDGYSDDNNGSIVGRIDPDFEADPPETYVETSIVLPPLSTQSMPFHYGYRNSMPAPGATAYSEATLTLEGVDRDWTREGVQSLSLWYIGHPVSQGSLTTGAGGIYTMTAAGRDIWDESDEFHFAYKSLTGVGSITAKVSAITTVEPGGTPHEWAKAGVMVRESLDPDSRHMFLATTVDHGVALQWRATTGEESFTAAEAPDASGRPIWIKLERDIQGTFTAFYASDAGGSPGTWQVIAFQGLQMQTAYIGLALTSHVEHEPVQAVFSNITTSQNVSGGEFEHKDIGILSNEPAPMYVSIANAGGQPVAVDNPDPNAALVTDWTEWLIPLTDFGGINFTDVDKISIRFGTQGGAPTGSGLVFFDDIYLYRQSCKLGLRPADFALVDYAPLGTPGGDCVVDYQELQIMADEWMKTDALLTAENRAADPAAYYPLDAGSGTVAADASGNGHDGTITGDDVHWIASQAVFGQALDFPGTDPVAGPNCVDTGTWDPSEGTGQLSVAAWIKWDGLSGFYQCVLAKRDAWESDSVMWYLELNIDTGQIGFQRYDVYPWFGDNIPTEGEWQHVAVTFDGTTAEMYTDGVSIGTDSFSLGPATGAHVVIGASDANGSNPFNGAIDEVYIFDRAISAEEVAHLAALAPADLLVPLASPAEISSDEPDGEKAVNFKDFALLAEYWLVEMLF